VSLNSFYIPNANKFFEGLLFLLQYCGDCVKENTDGGHAEFLARRQEEYQRTLCDLWVMYGRDREYGQENQRTQDLELLMQIMNSRLQSLAKLNSDFDHQIKALQKSQVLRRIHSYLLSKGQVMLKGLYMKLGNSKFMD